MMSDMKSFRSLFLFIVLSFVCMLLLFIHWDLLNIMVMYSPKNKLPSLLLSRLLPNKKCVSSIIYQFHNVLSISILLRVIAKDNKSNIVIA